ncbi:LOW QUALITY PROTEIN: dehydrogenase/reductase SDR family member 12 [Amazona ochrocephala]
MGGIRDANPQTAVGDEGGATPRTDTLHLPSHRRLLMRPENNSCAGRAGLDRAPYMRAEEGPAPLCRQRRRILVTDLLRTSYEPASKHFSPADVGNVAGRSFLVTGARSGIGGATAKETNIFLHILDIPNPKEIWKLAEIFKLEHKNVCDFLLCELSFKMYNLQEFSRRNENVERMFTFKRNYASVPGAFFTGENVASKFCVKLHDVELGYSLSSTYILTAALLPFLEKAADARLITVSSGTTLVQHTMLNIPGFYLGNGPLMELWCMHKTRQQVVLTEQWGKAHRNIHSVMHPSWADTPGTDDDTVLKYSAATGFLKMNMKNILCTEVQGAVVWMAVSSEAMSLLSGLFFQAMQPVPTHLPLASTHSPLEDKEKLREVLEQFSQKFKSTHART